MKLLYCNLDFKPLIKLAPSLGYKRPKTSKATNKEEGVGSKG
jgi:hypothetical protein